jgi:hypothetical protein
MVSIHLRCVPPYLPLGPRFLGAVSPDHSCVVGVFTMPIRLWLVGGAALISTFSLLALYTEGPSPAAAFLLLMSLALIPLTATIAWTVWRDRADHISYLQEALRASGLGAGV